MPEHVITTNGLSKLVEAVANNLSHMAVGEGDTEPQIGDETLDDEFDRNEIGDVFILGETAQVRTFYTNSELPTTLEELGWFSEGTDAIDTGTLVFHSQYNYTPATDDVLVILNIVAERSE